MSYILDALKKSEQERGHGGIPSVQTVHSSSLNYTNKKTYWPYILIAAVVLNIITVLYFVFYHDKPAENIVATEVKTSANNSSATTTTDRVQPYIAATAINQRVETAAKTTARSTEKAVSSSATVPPASAAKKAAMPSATEYKAGNEIKQITDKVDDSVAEDNTGIVEFDELPESIKQQLPAIIISAHVYSTNPQQRSIVINDNFMEEGEYFLDDLILDEITRDGAIFRYRDIKFHMGVVSGWQ
ncbi:MAG: general secretion pathway protein GspB [Gammaproteobacteria bacterium]|nr:general secretion pathway protein GspB [Gammaproteobacteria bacterium]